MPELLKIVLHLLTDQSGSSSRNLTPFCFSIWCQHGGHLQKEVKMTSNHCFIWSQTVIKNEKVLRPYLHFSSILFKIPVYQFIFLFFNKVLATIFESHLEFYGQDSPKTQEIPFYKIFDIRVSKKWHFICLYDPSDSKYNCLCFFQYGVGAYFWAAILDFKVTMVRNIVKSFYYISITFMMPELTGNYTSFAFLSSL